MATGAGDVVDGIMQLDGKQVPGCGVEVAAILYDERLSLATRGRKLLQWLIAPMPLKVFYEEFYERKPFYIPRNNANYNNGILTSARIRGETCAACHAGSRG